MWRTLENSNHRQLRMSCCFFLELTWETLLYAHHKFDFFLILFFLNFGNNKKIKRINDKGSLTGTTERHLSLGVHCSKLTLRNYPHFHTCQYSQYTCIICICKHRYTNIFVNIYVYLDLPFGFHGSAEIRTPQNLTIGWAEILHICIQWCMFSGFFNHMTSIFRKLEKTQLFRRFQPYGVFAPEVWSPEATPAAWNICLPWFPGTWWRRRNLWRLGLMGYNHEWRCIWYHLLLKMGDFPFLMDGLTSFYFRSCREVEEGSCCRDEGGRRPLLFWKFRIFWKLKETSLRVGGKIVGRLGWTKIF